MRRHHCLAHPPQGSDSAPGEGAGPPLSRRGYTTSGSSGAQGGDAYYYRKTENCQPHGVTKGGAPEIISEISSDLHHLSCLPGPLMPAARSRLWRVGRNPLPLGFVKYRVRITMLQTAG